MNRIYLGYHSQSAAKVSVLISVQLIWNALKSDEHNLGLRSPAHHRNALFWVSSFLNLYFVECQQPPSLKWKWSDRGQFLNSAGLVDTDWRMMTAHRLTVTLKWKTIIQQKLRPWSAADADDIILRRILFKDFTRPTSYWDLKTASLSEGLPWILWNLKIWRVIYQKFHLCNSNFMHNGKTLRKIWELCCVGCLNIL